MQKLFSNGRCLVQAKQVLFISQKPFSGKLVNYEADQPPKVGSVKEGMNNE